MIRISDLERNGINKLFDAKSAEEFVPAFASMIEGCCKDKAYEEACSCNPDSDVLPSAYIAQQVAQEKITDKLIRLYIDNKEGTIKYVPDDEMLKTIERCIRFRDVCEEHIDVKIGRGIRGRFKTARYHSMLLKVMLRNDIWLRMQGVFGAMTALFVNLGLGTPERLEEMVKALPKC